MQTAAVRTAAVCLDHNAKLLKIHYSFEFCQWQPSFEFTYVYKGQLQRILKKSKLSV